MAYPHLKLTEKQLHSIFKSIDTDNSGCVDKHEMAKFIELLMKSQKEIPAEIKQQNPGEFSPSRKEERRIQNHHRDEE